MSEEEKGKKYITEINEFKARIRNVLKDNSLEPIEKNNKIYEIIKE